MAVRGDQLGDDAGEGLVGMHCEDGEGVASLFEAALGEDDGYEVHAGALEKGERGGGGKEAHVSSGDVSDDVLAVVDHCDG